MKQLIFLLFIPLLSLGQERQIGTKQGSNYVFNWNMKTVVQKTFVDLNASFTVDTVFAENDSTVQVRFHDNQYVYGDIFRIKKIQDTIYTTIANGCLNTCYGYDCSACGKNSACQCICVNNGTCNSKNLAVFQSEPLSKWIRQRILTNANPTQ